MNTYPEKLDITYLMYHYNEKLLRWAITRLGMCFLMILTSGY